MFLYIKKKLLKIKRCDKLITSNYLTGTMCLLTVITLKIGQWKKNLKGWLVSSSYKENKA